MGCPVCNKNTVLVLHSDFIECQDCGSGIRIDYCVCKSCGAGFRLNNGSFMETLGVADMDFDEDGNIIGVSMNEEPNSDEDLASMSDLILPCARCQSPAVFKCDENTYECAECGFKWEILKNE